MAIGTNAQYPEIVTAKNRTNQQLFLVVNDEYCKQTYVAHSHKNTERIYR